MLRLSLRRKVLIGCFDAYVPTIKDVCDRNKVGSEVAILGLPSGTSTVYRLIASPDHTSGTNATVRTLIINRSSAVSGDNTRSATSVLAGRSIAAARAAAGVVE